MVRKTIRFVSAAPAPQAAPRPRTRRLGLEPLELRRLLTVTISGNIEVSSLAARKALVSVADAMVVASFTVGGQTQNQQSCLDRHQGPLPSDHQVHSHTKFRRNYYREAPSRRRRR